MGAGRNTFVSRTSLQILNAKYTTPETPSYPPTFSKLLASMLNPNPETRPDIFIILEGLCRLSGRQMDPNLKRLGRPESGRKTKSQRYLSFQGTSLSGYPAGDRRRDTPEASTSSPRSTNQLNSTSVPAGVSKSTLQRNSQPGGFNNPQKSQPRKDGATKPAVAVAQKEDLISLEGPVKPANDDWADFEGVFGGSEQTAMNKVQGTHAEPVAARWVRRGETHSSSLPSSESRILFSNNGVLCRFSRLA
mmetsp:Transcript_21537/g.87882  ORF Transcript_21537/g.87882 Transcript_21537/m.87882 type:complete len:248 (-) Transcript_21537:463-1206(-)